jgi:hypothetical protein
MSVEKSIDVNVQFTFDFWHNAGCRALNSHSDLAYTLFLIRYAVDQFSDIAITARQ